MQLTLGMNRTVLLAVIVAVVLGCGSGRAEELIYVVRKNDTLSGIALKYKLSVSALAARNRIKEPNRIYVGQKIVIPTQAPSLPDALQAELAKVPVEPGRWRHIVIHHSGSVSGNMKIFDRYHREERRMENGLAYHFVIGNGRGMGDGEIGMGGRWLEQLDGGHLASLPLNQSSIGICLVGNFDEAKPTPRQMESLIALTLYLMDRCDLSSKAVQTHQQINTIYTRCPGRRFPSKTFHRELRDASSDD